MSLWVFVYQASVKNEWLLENGDRWLLENGSGFYCLSVMPQRDSIGRRFCFTASAGTFTAAVRFLFFRWHVVGFKIWPGALRLLPTTPGPVNRTGSRIVLREVFQPQTRASLIN